MPPHHGHPHLDAAHADPLRLGLLAQRKPVFHSDKRSRQDTGMLQARDFKFGSSAFKSDIKETIRKQGEDPVAFGDSKYAYKDKSPNPSELKDVRNLSPPSTSQDSLQRQASLSTKPRIWSISEIIESPSTSSSESEKFPHGELAAFYERNRFSFTSRHLSKHPVKFPFPPTNPPHSPPTPPQGEGKPEASALSFAHSSQQSSLLSSFKQCIESNPELRHNSMIGSGVSDIPLALINSHRQSTENRLPIQLKPAHRSYPFHSSTPKSYEAVRGWMAKNEDYINRHRNVSSPNTDYTQDFEKRDELHCRSSFRSSSPLSKTRSPNDETRKDESRPNSSKSPPFWKKPSKSPNFERCSPKSPETTTHIANSNANIDLSVTSEGKLLAVHSSHLKSECRTIKTFPDPMSSSPSPTCDVKPATSHRL